MALNLLTAFIITFLITVIVSPVFIKNMRRLQYGQQIRAVGPAQHAVKAGTPTMGGLVFILSAVLVSFILVGFSPLLFAVLLVTLGCGLIGFLDDFGKIAHARSLGLKARTKLAGEIVITAFLILLMQSFGFYSTEVMLPFFNFTFDIGFFYPIFVFLIISAASNSVNLTDGVDGLAAGTSAIALIAFMIIAGRAGSIEIVLFCAALTGACSGFLVYNYHPARLFMGDTGSLALGGAFAVIAVLTKAELFLIIIGGVFVLEALSVIAQVISFRLTGRRILLMSPLHHHFEMKGWSERQVATSFWSAALLFAVIGVLAYNHQF